MCEPRALPSQLAGVRGAARTLLILGVAEPVPHSLEEGSPLASGSAAGQVHGPLLQLGPGRARAPRA